ncbi:MAG TPA: penicillin-binding protein 2 [Kofleriaceae bacterium]|nr:penicillin-binding protein 2 [Kofleriaceae bacterium]
MLIHGHTAAAETVPHFRRRMRWVLAVIAIAFVILAGRLWQLQVVRGDRYYARTVSNVIKERSIPAIRGKIVDRNGIVLATNRPAFNIYATPAKLGPNDQAKLALILGLSATERQDVAERIAEGQRRNPRIPALILEDQSRDRAALIAQARLELSGVTARDEPYRYYPFSDLAAHVLGYMNQVTPEEAEKLASRGYDPSAMIGRYGLEREWESYLRGKPGRERFVVNASGERVEAPVSARIIHGPELLPPMPGHNVVLTLDKRLQAIAEREAKTQAAAAVVVVEVKTGRILAMASVPAFDPNIMTGHLSAAEHAVLASDPRKPFIDKTLRQHYPPGSTFKPFTAIAAIDSGLVSPAEDVFCGGSLTLGRRTFHCHGSHGKIDMAAAIQRSCNVYFWKASERIGLDRIAQVAHAFGFGAQTGLGLNGDIPGRIPTVDWYERRGYFTEGYTLNAAVGQGDVLVTVVQLAMAYAALANGGTLYVPQVVLRVESWTGDLVAAYEPVVRRHIEVSDRALATVRHGMWMAVNERGGTAFRRGRSDVVTIAGKTGTAQVRSTREKISPEVGWYPERAHAWFAGYAPAENPEIAIAVLVEHGGAGGGVAAPIAKAVVEAYMADKAKDAQP